jgi:tetratricopeptide (TPR) repeat protein
MDNHRPTANEEVMPRRPVTISLCMIVRNEERYLADCLRGVAALFDEIIIVDTGSTDRTPAIAESFGAKLVRHPWSDDFAAARNVSLEHATGDWVFWLDADDRIDAVSAEKLAALFDSLDHTAKGFVMGCRCLRLAPTDPIMIVNHPRLFRRHPAVHWEGRVHEQIMPSIQRANFDLAWSDVVVDHVGYQEEAAARRKHQRNLRLLQLENLARPDDAFVLFHMGMALMGLGASGRAIEVLQKSVNLTREVMPYTRKTFAVLARLLWDNLRRDEAQTLVRTGLTCFADDPELLLIQAEQSASLCNWRLAEASLLRLMTAPPKEYFQLAVPDDIRTKTAPRELAAIYGQQGLFQEAEAVLRGLLNKHPDYVFGWVNLGQLYLMRRQWDMAEAVVGKMGQCPGGEPYVATIRAEIHIAQGNAEQARQWLDRAVALAPSMPWPRILRIRWLDLVGARRETRLAAIQDLLRLSPGDVFGQRALAELSRPTPQEAPAEMQSCSSIVVQAGQPA